jgi:hypothetical protein
MEFFGGGSLGGPEGKGFLAPVKPNSPIGIRRGSLTEMVLSVVRCSSLPGERMS